MHLTRGATLTPQMPGKIERWHKNSKNRILLVITTCPGDLKQKIADFISHYNHLRYPNGSANLTPPDVYFGRGQTIRLEREKITNQTFMTRRLHHHGQAA